MLRRSRRQTRPFGPTFEVTHQAVGHVLVEILNALGQLVCTQVLGGRQVGHSYDAFLKTLDKQSRGQQTFLLDMFTRKARHCLWISRPGFCRFFKNSTKSLDTWSVSKLAWRLMDGLGVLPSGVSDQEEAHLADFPYQMETRRTANQITGRFGSRLTFFGWGAR